MRASQRVLISTGICLGIAVGAMVFSAINTALASIQRELGASLTQLQWIMNIFGIAICSTLVTFGRLADLFGRKKLYLLGILLLGISLLGSGLAPNANWIIFFQALLGLAAGILLPVSQALISHAYPENERSKAIGLWAAVVGLAMAAGPLLSGLIIAVLGWRWVFLGNLPIVLGSLVLVALFAPESRSEEQQTRIDYGGIFFLTVMISTFVLAVIQSESWNFEVIISLYVVSAIALVGLIWVEKKAAFPIVHEELLTHRTFLTASIANLCLIFFVWACFFLIPLYLQTIHHYSPLQAGLMMLWLTIPLAIFSFTVGHLYKRVGPKLLMAVGFGFLLLSAGLQMNFHPETAFVWLAMGAAAFGIGWGLIWGPSTTAAISTLPLREAGIASGTFTTLQEIGGTVGLAITGTVVRAHSNLLLGYHNGMRLLLGICVLGLVSTVLMRVSRGAE